MQWKSKDKLRKAWVIPLIENIKQIYKMSLYGYAERLHYVLHNLEFLEINLGLFY